MLFIFLLLSWLLPAAALVTGSSKHVKRAVVPPYELKKGPLDTPWTDKVGTDPWPEYPRPQLQRSEWKNLNGVWQYRNATEGEAPPFGVDLEDPVLVPFCLESALSGVMGNYHTYSWYRTTFDVPSSWTAGNRVFLNFGAVDYEATVYVNGQNATFHRGGYWSFDVDVTDHLSTNGTNELIVFVYDPTNMDDVQIPSGKQSVKFDDHIFYTPCSGIWQTVWLESAPREHVAQLDLSADMHGEVNVTVHSSGNTSTPVEITVYEPGSTNVKTTATGRTNSAFQFTVDSPELWSPNSPTLYNITVKVGGDIIQTYTGFRTVSRGIVDGVERPLLNGEFLFWFGTLDQGFWPDGIYTPPSLEAMKFDLEALKAVGYNMLRKHIKVETALFYQACDELGIMLIQDMPALRPSVPTGDCSSERVGSQDAQNEFDRQLAILIQQHKSYPSIVAWVIYNEGWGQEIDKEYPEFRLTDLVRGIDSTRLIDSVTGWNDHGAGDFHDNHHYPDSQCGTPWYSIQSTPYDPQRIAIQGEFGGIGHNLSIENMWNVQWSIDHINNTYELDANLDIWNERAHFLLSELKGQVEKYACSGAVWTQTTDVEGEVNGMLSYDRRINRMDQDMWKQDIQALYDAAAARAGNSSMPQTARGIMMDGL